MTSSISASPLILPMDATGDVALRQRAKEYAAALHSDPASAGNLLRSAAAEAGDGPCRLVTLAGDATTLAASLSLFASGGTAPDQYSGGGQRPSVVFVFPGQGTQWPGMARQLLAAEAAFRDEVEKCDAAVTPVAGWSPLAALHGRERVDLESGIDVVQPMLFAVQVGLAALWRSWGIEPDLVIGHSMGEVAAAYVAGALDLPDAATIAVHRSRLLRKVGSTGGGMALAGVSYASAQELVSGEPEVAVAASNGPETTVLTGDLPALRRIVERLQAKDIFSRLIEVDAPAHSPRVEEVLEEMRAAAADIKPGNAVIPLLSTVTCQQMHGPELDAGYWADNLRQPVLFWQAIAGLANSSSQVFVELSPHPTLLPAIVQGIGQGGPDRCFPSLRRDEDEQQVMLRSLAGLYAGGRSVRWQAALPSPALLAMDDIELGAGLQSIGGTGVRTWQATIRPESPSYVADHKVQGLPVLPATAYLDLALRVASDGTAAAELSGVEFLRPLVVDTALTVRCVRSDTGAAGPRIQILARDARAGGEWLTYAEASIGSSTGPRQVEALLDEARAACPEPVALEQFYADLELAGLAYGPRFRLLTGLWRGEQTAVGRVGLPSGRFPHPAWLDACLQVALAALPQPDGWLPYGLDRFRVMMARDDERWETASWVQARIRMDQGDVSADVFLTTELGEICVAAEGLRLRSIGNAAAAARRGTLADWAYSVVWEPIPVPAPIRPRHWLIIGEPVMSRALAARVTASGGIATVGQVSAGRGFRTLLDESFPPGTAESAGVLLIAEEISGPAGAVEQAQQATCGALLHLAQALDGLGGVSPIVRVATAGSQLVVANDRPNATHAALWGLGRVIANERPDLGLRLIDFDPADDEGAVSLFMELEVAQDDAGTDHETQIAWRQGTRYGARLRRAGLPVPKRLPAGSARYIAAGQAAELSTDAPGDLDAVGPRWARAARPGPGEVEIEVAAGGLNFADVMRAMGMIDGSRNGPLALGLEASGLVKATGPGVDRVRPGDRVITIWDSSSGGLASRRTVDARLVAVWPQRLSAVEAATLPGAFLTAEYSLKHIGRLQPGERVLIHAATGGVGLAAIQIAQQLGAEIFASAGTAEKRALLRSLGIAHVTNSRSLDFVDEVRDATDGHGVDVVLNSLAGEAIQRGLEVLAPFGRFVELGKRDVQQNLKLGLEPLRNNLTFAVVDIDQLIRRRPEVAGDLLRSLADRFEVNELYPLPVETVPVEHAHRAVRRMARGQHMGKLAVRFSDGARPKPAGPVRADATYLITGGLGGLGLLTAGVLVALGARRLRLISRRPPGPDTARALDALRETGAHIETFAVDVADAEGLERVIATVDSRHPVRGVVHAAGFLEDAALARQTWQGFASVMAPKVSGAWNLHTLTEGMPLDFFWMYSSAAAILGTAGQANYAAANSFLDGLAAQRVANGLPAMSINWGAWSDIGAVREEVGALLADRGIGAITPLAGARWITSLLVSPPPGAQVAIMAFHAGDWARANPAAARAAFLRDLRPAEAPAGKDKERSSAEPPSAGVAASDEIVQIVRSEIARIVRLPVDRVGLSDRITRLGVDSLMAVELRNALTTELGVVIAIMVLLRDPTVADLCKQVADAMTGGGGQHQLPPLAVPELRAAPDAGELLRRVHELNEAEVDALIAAAMEKEELR